MSGLGHVAIGLVGARLTGAADEPPARLAGRMVLLSALALLPDVDFVIHELAPSIATWLAARDIAGAQSGS